MSIIIDGKKFNIPGLNTVCWDDGNPKIKYVTDKEIRSRQTRLIVMHTHEGIKGQLLEGFGPNTTIDERLAMYQTSTDRYVSWDGTIDQNGDITWQNDPGKHFTWQAGNHVNALSIGMEMVQSLGTTTSKHGDLWRGQIEKAVLFIDVLTAKLGIQRQIPWDKKNNKPVLTQIPRLQGSEAGEDVVGIVGHVQLTPNRGVGDPGPFIFEALRDAGYELFDIGAREDIETWKKRQIALGLSAKDADGVPLSKTVSLLKAKGRKHGLWISRPIDSQIEEV